MNEKNFFTGKKKQQPTAKAEQVSAALTETNQEEIYSDVTGSYTGTPVDGIEPTQDVDDL